MRIVIAEDLTLLREGLTRLLRDRGWEIVAAVDNGPALVDAIVEHRPDLALVDVRLPPSFTDEGVRAAIEARERVPGTPVLILSQYVEESYAGDLLASEEGGVGYLLKDRVADVRQFTESLQRVAGGGTAMDPEVVAQLLGRRDNRGPLAELTPRERRGAHADGRGPLQHRHRDGAGDLGQRDREARQAGVHEARPAAVGQRPPPRARRPQVPGRLAVVALR